MLLNPSSPFVTYLCPVLTQTTDVTLAFSASSLFVAGLTSDPDLIPFHTRMAWTGLGVQLSPAVKAWHLGRKQNPQRLVDEGAKGLPVLVVHGSADGLDGRLVVEEVKKVFADVGVTWLDGVGHTPFLEAFELTREAILTFVLRVSTV